MFFTNTYEIFSKKLLTKTVLAVIIQTVLIELIQLSKEVIQCLQCSLKAVLPFTNSLYQR